MTGDAEAAVNRVETFVSALERHGHGSAIVSCRHGHEAHWPGPDGEYVPLHAGDLRDVLDELRRARGDADARAFVGRAIAAGSTVHTVRGRMREDLPSLPPITIVLPPAVSGDGVHDLCVRVSEAYAAWLRAPWGSGL